MASESGDVRQFPRHKTVDELRAEAEQLAEAYDGERVDFDAVSYSEQYERLIAEGKTSQAVQLVFEIEDTIESWYEHLRFFTVTYANNMPDEPILVVYSGKVTKYLAGKPIRTKNWDDYLNGDEEVPELRENRPQLTLVVTATERTVGEDTRRYWRESTRPDVNIPLESILFIQRDKPMLIPEQPLAE